MAMRVDSRSQAAQAFRDAARDAPEPWYHKPKTPIGRRGESLNIVADYPREDRASPAPLHLPEEGRALGNPRPTRLAGVFARLHMEIAASCGHAHNAASPQLATT